METLRSTLLSALNGVGSIVVDVRYLFFCSYSSSSYSPLNNHTLYISNALYFCFSFLLTCALFLFMVGTYTMVALVVSTVSGPTVLLIMGGVFLGCVLFLIGIVCIIRCAIKIKKKDIKKYRTNKNLHHSSLNDIKDDVKEEDSPLIDNSN
jgi:hypothetical protein